MKKLFTFLLIASLFNTAYSQSFKFEDDTIYVSGPQSADELVGHGFVKNLQVDSNFTWKRVTNSFTANNWTSAICDNIACWSVDTDRNSFIIAPGDSSILDPHVLPANTSGSGVVRLAVWVGNDSANSDTITYLFNTWATSAKKVRNEKTLKIYPNPARTTLTLDFESNGPLKVEVYDVLGKKVAAYEHNGTLTTLDVSYLTSGLYIIKVYENGKTYSRTFKKTDN